MAKKYLFNKIVIDGNNFKFYTCRFRTKLETLSTKVKFGETMPGHYSNGIINTSYCIDDIIIPRKFKQFLNCLELTKLDKNTNTYNITELRNKGTETVTESITFNEVLKKFAAMINEDVLYSKKDLEMFYITAQNIYKNEIDIKNDINNNDNLLER